MSETIIDVDFRHAYAQRRCKCGATWVEGGGYKGYAFHLEDVLTSLAIEASKEPQWDATDSATAPNYSSVTSPHGTIPSGDESTVWSLYESGSGAGMLGVIEQPTGRIIAPAVLDPQSATEIVSNHRAVASSHE